MTKEEYIKRFVARMCEAAALYPDDETALAEAETFWDEYACKDDNPDPESDADEAMLFWSE
jgi:hypothetical protein